MRLEKQLATIAADYDEGNPATMRGYVVTLGKTVSEHFDTYREAFQWAKSVGNVLVSDAPTVHTYMRDVGKINSGGLSPPFPT